MNDELRDGMELPALRRFAQIQMTRDDDEDRAADPDMDGDDDSTAAGDADQDRTQTDAQDAAYTAPPDETQRIFTFSFSSEAPVGRSFGAEILSHARNAPNLARLNNAAPLLFNHNMDDVVGVVERAWVEGGRGMCTVRFAKSPRAQEVLGMVRDGILRNVSFMYQVDQYEETGAGGKDTPPEYTARQWEAFEISIVTIPADPSVGLGRSVEAAKRRVQILSRNTPAGTPAVKTEIIKMDQMELDTVRKTAGEAETLRVRALETLAAQHNIPADVRAAWVANGVSTADARGAILEQIMARGPQPGVANFGNQDLDMGKRDGAAYSVVRAINAAATGDWSKAGLEREAGQAIAKAAGREMKANSFIMPSNLPFAPTAEHKRAYAALNPKGAQLRAPYAISAAGTGGNLVETTLMDAQFIEVLRNATITSQLGARYITGLVGNVNIPRQATATATYWVGESAAPTETEATFDQVQLRPRTIAALSKMSRLALLQTTPAIEMLARMDLVAQMALGIDLAAISGTGASGQPTGIVNTSGVYSVVGGTNGANLTFDHIIQLYSGLRIANAPQANLGFAINAKAYGYLSTLKATTGQYLWMPSFQIAGAPADTLRGYPYAVSNQLRSNLTKGTATAQASELVFGNWQELLIGEWGVTEIMVNPYDSTGFTTGDVLIRAFQTLDVQLRHAASFSVMSDALTPGF